MKFRITGILILFFFLNWLASFLIAPYLFRDLKFSPVLYSTEHALLAAKVSSDGQWRFPVNYNIPEKYQICLKQFEDRRFDFHIGIDPIAIIRALHQNIKAGEIQSGGSTISMQLARLLLNNPPRTIWNKLKECWLAIGLEFNFSKKKLLAYYTALAPFGGNVVGLEAAVWRYFQKDAADLSWAEAATLAVLPNQPSQIHIEKNRNYLLNKRNQLLKVLHQNKLIDSETYDLSLLEPIPERMHAMPRIAGLLLEYLIRKHPEKYLFHTTLHGDIQENFLEISTHYAKTFNENNIQNMAILLVDNQSGKVISYIANAEGSNEQIKNDKVNNIHALRSSGSILKPVLFAAALDKGLICSKTLLPDIPTLISNFRPENFSRTYCGALAAEKCLQRSLNVPAVRLLQMFGLNFFYNTLINVGFTGLFRSSGDYGLSLILGGAEVTAWDLAKVYSNMAQRLLQIDTESYVVKDLNILDDASDNPLVNYSNSGISRAAIFDMIQAMKGTELPEEFSNRFYIENQRKIAWKTGTSFGFKDAWCVGITPEHTMVVWVGNSSGLGRPGLIGVYTAAPLLFELFQSLHESTKEWTVPYDEMHKVVVCRETGYPVSLNCDQKDTIFSASDLSGMSLCPYHISIYTDSLKKHRVFISCEPNAISMHWFNLPPVMEYYYKKSHPEYIPVPPLSKLCSKEAVSEKVIEFIYPDRGAEVFIPLDLDERMNKVILKATHSNTEANIYWFMDDTFLGVTMNGQHEWAIDPLPGTHYLKISDEQGRSAVAVLNCYRRNQQAITHKF